MAEFKKYKRLPKEIEAFKYVQGLEDDCLIAQKPLLVKSTCGKFYCIDHPDKPGMCWLSFKPLPGAVAEARKKDKPHGWVQFEKKDGTEIYHRKVLPFHFFPEIKPDIENASSQIDPQSKLLFDYAYANNWKDVDLTVFSRSVESEGFMRVVNQNDYVVRQDGKLLVVPQTIFEQNYAAV